jgi:hypothetical protein
MLSYDKMTTLSVGSQDQLDGMGNKDRDKAKDIAEALKQQGLSVWWDRSILPGETFDTVIEEALDAAKCVIVLWSRTSVSSKWVKTEASEGDQRGILIPVLIDDVKIPLAFRLMQAADLRDWVGKLPHLGFDNLLKAVADILGRPPAVQPGQKTKEVRDIEPEKVHISIEEPEKIAKQDNSIGMKFTLIPAGEFNMGSEESDDEKPVHKVKINNPFYLGTYAVTQAEWEAVMGSNPSKFNGDDLPVENVSWDDVQEFIKKLNEKEAMLRMHALILRKTHPVGQKKPNPWGLYDMHGNVREWVQDSRHDSYDGAPADGSAWESGGRAKWRVNRGGGWLRVATICRSASRFANGQGHRESTIGFRLLREL